MKMVIMNKIFRLKKITILLSLIASVKGFDGISPIIPIASTMETTPPVATLASNSSAEPTNEIVTAPTITSVSLASDNSTITVTFSEGVFKTSGGHHSF